MIYNRKVIEKAIKKALLAKAIEAGYVITPDLYKAVESSGITGQLEKA